MEDNRTGRSEVKVNTEGVDFKSCLLSVKKRWFVIWLAVEPTDMRCGFDRLAERVRVVVGQVP